MECVKEDPHDYIEYLTNNPDAALTFDLPYVMRYYKKLDEQYESGWYDINDSPTKIADELNKKGIDDFIFVIDDVEQFRTNWSVWVKRVKS